MSESKEGALPFIMVEDDGKFSVNPEAVKYLQTLEGEIGVVAIAGLYRTGKSYLLNQLMEKSGGFQVGPTVKACTKGIWLWGKAMKLEDRNMHLLFLDTEGLGSTSRSESYDCRVFALALLLSSLFVYNSVGTIDGSAINKLSLVVNLTRVIHVKAQTQEEDTGREYSAFFPNFFWIVRDFTVKLEKNGKAITSQEYLDQALEPEEEVDDSASQKNVVREMIRNFFPKRDCLTMVRPVTDEKQLQALDRLPKSDLRPEFVKQLDVLKNKVYKKIQPKRLYGKALSGAMLAYLAEAYVEAINTDKVPTISTAWERVVSQQCETAKKEALRVYEATMHDRVKAIAQKATSASQSSEPEPEERVLEDTTGGFPENDGTVVEEHSLWEIHREARKAALEVFRQDAVQDAESAAEYEKVLREEMFASLTKRLRSNEDASRQLCEEWLKRLHQGSMKLAKELLRQKYTTAAPPAPPVRARSNAGEDAETKSQGAEADEEGSDGKRRVTAELASSLFQTSISRLCSVYSRHALGPSANPVLIRYLNGHGNGTELLAVFLGAVTDATENRVESLNRWGLQVQGLLKEVEVRLEGVEKDFRATKEAHERETRRIASENAAEQQRLQSIIDEKAAHNRSLSSQVERSAKAQEEANAEYKEKTEAFLSHIAKFDNYMEEKEEEMKKLRKEKETMTEKYMEAKEETAKLHEKLEAQTKEMQQYKEDAALADERVRSAQVEATALREQTDLLYETVKSAREALASKTAEKEEFEFQVADMRAKYFQRESDLSILRSLVAKLKGKLLSLNKLSGLGLDKHEQGELDALEAYKK